MTNDTPRKDQPMKQARDPAALRAAVTARDLTHRELARLVETSHAHIRFILLGRPCDDAIARRLARVLRRTLGDLFADPMTTNTTQIVSQQVAG